MAIQVVFGEAESRGVGPQIMEGHNGVEEAITAGGAASTITAPASPNKHPIIARVTNDSGASIYVSFGAAPNAATDTCRFLILDGQVEYFGVNEGDKAAAAVAA